MKNLSALVVITALALSGCQQEALEKKSVIKPVKLVKVHRTLDYISAKIPGTVRAAQRAELSFDIPGRIVKLNAKEGRKISKGDIIAKLDDRDIKQKYHATKARLKESKATFERYQSLIKDNAIPKSSLDAAQRNYEVDLVNMKLAKKALADCTLKAYFSGTIAARYVENFQNVKAKQAIVSIEDKSTLEIVVYAPEAAIAKTKQTDIISMYASFAAITDEKFALKIKEVSEKIDPATRTYAVVFTMQPNKKFNLLSGMTANIELQIKSNSNGEAKAEHKLMLPVTAVMGGSDNNSYVWIYSAVDNSVSKRQIKIGKMQGQQIQVLSGLELGETVVAAGVNYLAEGMIVKPLTGKVGAAL